MSLVFVVFFVFELLGSGGCKVEEDNRKNWDQRLNKLTNEKFKQGKSELVFLLDRSGSVGVANFEIEKGFVENLLTNFAVTANGTRVAVVTYSRTSTLHVDYLKTPKNKCFLAEELQEIRYEGSEQTNTASALLLARTVLRQARKNVNKVVVLLSDGISTAGQDPVKTAKLLKEENIEIFTFAIGKFLRLELDAIATDLNHTFHAINFKQFRKLARRVRGDPHDRKWQTTLTTKSCDYLCDNIYAGQDFDPGCCDANAKCTCGLASGLYNCVCDVGYFGENGLKGDCTACPIGTYKDNFEPSYRCEKCPRHSTTLKEGGSSLSHCKCVDGYHGNPSGGKPCKINRCPPLQSPTNGRILGRCNTKYRSKCFFACNIGYVISDRNGRERTCQANKMWSGVTTTCARLKCDNLQAPDHGTKTCKTNDNSWGTLCSFSCNQGYILIGSKSRLCGPSALWSGYQPECQIVTCPVLQRLQYGRIMPSSCTNDRTEFNKPCFFNCYGGFLLAGPKYMICNRNGIWETQNNNTVSFKLPKCQDVERPRTNCPPPLEVESNSGVDYAWVAWNKPKFWDNSDTSPKVQWHPNYRKEKAKFTIGDHAITYKASDAALLTTVCVVRIRVLDKEPPRVVHCPNDVLANTTELEEPIFWKEPQFEDNSGNAVKMFSTYSPGHKFQIGKWLVLYIASDESGNEATCEFTVVVNKHVCPFHPPPVNGALTCSDWLRGEFCQVYCNERFEFAKTPATWYVCNSKSKWKTIPPNSIVPWPDCSDWSIPKAKRKLIGHYFTGNCKDKKVQEIIKKTYLKYFKKKFETSVYCKTDRSCKVEAVNVECGRIKGGKRTKRDLESSTNQSISIEFEFAIEASRNVSQEKLFVNELIKSADSILLEDDTQQNSIETEMKNEGISWTQGRNSDVYNTILECRAGQIMKNNECVNCPVGTYLSESSKTCENCQVGYFQDEEAQLNCKRCPIGEWTVGDHNRNFTECKKICEAGTYSSSGLETCKACPKGTYQNALGQKDCILCPSHTTTSIIQANNSTYCQPKCQTGTSSDNGLKPCEPCQIGRYQDSIGQQYCKECSGHLSTLKKGSRSRSLCRIVNHCADNVCENNGECVSGKHNFVCKCSDGFYGLACVNQTDLCLSSPCEHNSTCITKRLGFECRCNKGFSGPRCEKEIDECLLFPCMNQGTCMDKIADYQCFCPRGYSGKNCEVDEDLCFDNPCGSDGVCVDTGNDHECRCNLGFEGQKCEIDIDDCNNVTCKNNGRCMDSVNGFTCVCLSGFNGVFCEINIDECLRNPCRNGGQCVDRIAHFQCSCRPGFSGKVCEQKMDSNFRLNFPKPKLSNYAVSRGTIPEMTEFTIDGWIQTNHKPRVTGTILSYAVVGKDSSKIIDNALTVMDPSNLKIYINNKVIYTDLEVDDGLWHRITITWSGIKNGTYKVYLDNKVMVEGYKASNEVISGGGSLVLGQDQDVIGGNFNIMESFEGNMSSIKIWKKPVEFEELPSGCDSSYYGSQGLIVSWPDFTIEGSVNLIKNQCP